MRYSSPVSRRLFSHDVLLSELAVSDIVMTVEEKAVLAANDVELLDAVAELERIVHELPVPAPAYDMPVVGPRLCQSTS